MYAPGVLWTAARHKIPILSVMHNNRGYHQEVMHVQRMANRRDRVAALGMDRSPIGTSIENPDIDFAGAREVDGLLDGRPDQGSRSARPDHQEGRRGRQSRRAGADRRVDAAAVRTEFMNTRRVMFALAAVAAGLVLGSGDGFAASAEKGKQLYPQERLLAMSW